HNYSIDYYMSFVSNILLWAGLVFETPLVMFFLAKLGVVTPQGFAKARRVVVVGAAVGAAIITPTVDPVNMLLIMGPFLLLYELGILLARLA
ncbi:MAG: twin-arginine translocase subunit TatC, partial [Chloroflexi bacterium]|nr:twin-arginine translocase subunit TatC [Chloroflexota bacterium]